METSRPKIPLGIRRLESLFKVGVVQIIKDKQETFPCCTGNIHSGVWSRNTHAGLSSVSPGCPFTSRKERNEDLSRESGSSLGSESSRSETSSKGLNVAWIDRRLFTWIFPPLLTSRTPGERLPRRPRPLVPEVNVIFRTNIRPTETMFFRLHFDFT